MTSAGFFLVVLAAGVALAVRGRRWSRTNQAAAWSTWLLILVAGVYLIAGAYEARKTLSLCLMPLGLLWVVLAALFLERLAAGRGRQAWGFGVLWVGLTAAGSVPLGCVLVGGLEQPYLQVRPLHAGPFEAVLVLGGGVAVSADGRVMAGAAGDRVVLAGRMYRAGRAGVLVATGPLEERGDGSVVNFADAERRLWIDLGVPPGAIVPVVGPRTTSEEIEHFAGLVRERGWRRVAVLSSAWHLRRAGRLCDRFGLEAELLPADFLGFTDVRGIRALVPQEDGLLRTQHFLWEILGVMAGR